MTTPKAPPADPLLSCGVESETCECCDGKGWYPWRVKGGKYGWYPWYEQHCKACNGTGRIAKRQPQAVNDGTTTPPRSDVPVG